MLRLGFSMNHLISFLASILGILMDLFFRGLTLIGYPRLWAAIVLFAAVTRLLFLPEKIGAQKSKLLDKVVARDLRLADPEYFVKTKDKAILAERNKLKKAIHKKYKIKKPSGCLVALIQYPFLVALFYVVKNPQEFIPSLEGLTSVSAEVNTFLGVSLAAVPLTSMKEAGTVGLIIFVPLIIMFSNLVKISSSFKLAQTTAMKIRVYLMGAILVLALGWFSASLPLAISLYWITNDITNAVFGLLIKKYVPKNKAVAMALREYDESVRQEAERKQREAQCVECGPDTPDAASADADAIFNSEGEAMEAELPRVPCAKDTE